ncbi:keratin-associated protein 26-1-like [Dipodomys spectabilis]|uniref:keratin-associated protein 26-1-like n=1 Tax=Dipodomys spectabilis TaxID=105255 RepID=UPI001C53FF99|nr:keratin-associated protein 26-1-like [Dipodomys spectabilis]
MSDNNCCCDNSSSPSLRNSCHLPVTSPNALHSTEVSCGDVPCSSSSSLGSHVAHDSSHELCGERRSFQSNTCERNACSPSSCSPTVSDVSGFHQGTSCLPLTSQSSSFRSPVSSRQLVSRQPLSYLTCGNQPLSYLRYDRQPLRYLSNGCQPFTCMSDYYRPTNYTYSNFQRYSSSGNW